MTDEAEVGAGDGIDTFLIAEHQHFGESFWKTEELGEKRLNFFISLLTASSAGLVLLATSETGFTRSQVRWVAVTTGFALLLLGISTLMRMLRRNEVTDQYKDALKLVRKTFAERYGLQGYDPFEPLPRQLFTGGLAQTAALLNSMIAGAVGAGLFLSSSTAILVPVGALVFVISLVAQFAYIAKRNERR